MASINTRTRGVGPRTYEGAPAVRFGAEKELRRAVASCLLWEDSFYESGVEIAQRISDLCEKVSPESLAALAVEARERFKLRHVPLLLTTKLAKTGSGKPIVADTVERVVQRADELAELVAVYWGQNPKKAGKNAPLSAQMKKGLARAFNKFDAYQLAKYNRDNAVKLRDVLFLSHAKAGEDRDALYKSLIDGKLAAPDTWEVALSGGADKKEAFERLLREGKLGYLALLRNLRNMDQAGVDRDLVNAALRARKGGAERVLPFRFVAAAKAAPSFARALDDSLLTSIKDMDQLPGRTIVLVDVSGSMDAKLSAKSDLNRIDAAATLAAIIPSDDVRVITFSTRAVEVPAFRGLAGIEKIKNSQPHNSTDLGGALRLANTLPHDRLIVITDEQSATMVSAPKVKHAYMINVAGYKNGVGFGDWVRIEGFSENVLRFIREYEASKDAGEF